MALVLELAFDDDEAEAEFSPLRFDAGMVYLKLDGCVLRPGLSLRD